MLTFFWRIACVKLALQKSLNVNLVVELNKFQYNILMSQSLALRRFYYDKFNFQLYFGVGHLPCQKGLVLPNKANNV